MRFVGYFPCAMGAILVLGLSAAGCSGDKGASAPAGGGTNASRPAGVAASPGPAAANRCPLTAEQVSTAVGAPVKGPDASCSFFPVDESKIRPHAVYVKQVAFACNGNMPGEIGYQERLEGLSQVAYIREQADGWWILVCRGTGPFEVGVDLAGDEAARAAVTALAKQVLAIE